MGINSELSTYVALDAPVKLVVVKVRNRSGRTRRLSVSGYWELVLGQWRHANLMHVVTEIDPNTGALFARNVYNREFAGKTVFASVNESARTVTGSRTEFVGRNGTLASPTAMRHTQLSGKTGASLDPCAALQVQFELADGQERELVFVFGAGNNTEEAHQLVRRFSGPASARLALESVWEFWKRTLGVVYAETPDPALNLLVNGWLGVPDAGLSLLGPERLLPIGRRVWFPRSIAGHRGAAPRRARDGARASAAVRGPAVPRGRRPTLVASAHRPRACAHIFPTITFGCRMRRAGM